jgi:muramoyltetrapeptide carboxypeptidase
LLADNGRVKKHIYIYSPSGAVRDKAAFRRGVRRLKALGHEVEIDIDALASSTRFAGDDAQRVAAIHRAADSGADVALISRGGYGLSRILGDIDYGRVAQAIERKTQFVGISDFTAFQLALYAKTKVVSWAGPALCEGFGADPAPDDIMEDCFNDMLLGQGEGVGWRRSLKKRGIPIASDIEGPVEWGVQNATLWGGNLAMVVSLMGTPYFPSIKGGVLFLEDIGEHPYRIERMFTQLLHSGVLAKQKAIVLGQFTGFQLGSHDRGFNMAHVQRWLQTRIDTPVVDQLPYGHVQTKVLLPVGARVDLMVQGRDVLIGWGHL